MKDALAVVALFGGGYCLARAWFEKAPEWLIPALVCFIFVMAV